MSRELTEDQNFSFANMVEVN